MPETVGRAHASSCTMTVTLDLVQLELDRGDRFSLFPIGGLDRPQRKSRPCNAAGRRASVASCA